MIHNPHPYSPTRTPSSSSKWDVKPSEWYWGGLEVERNNELSKEFSFVSLSTSCLLTVFVLLELKLLLTTTPTRANATQPISHTHPNPSKWARPLKKWWRGLEALRCHEHDDELCKSFFFVSCFYLLKSSFVSLLGLTLLLRNPHPSTPTQTCPRPNRMARIGLSESFLMSLEPETESRRLRPC